MGIQTMVSQGGGGGGHQSQFRASGRQLLPYSLTLSEVQNQLGEPLQSMNLDKLLRNVLPPDEDQPFTIDLESNSSQIMKNPNLPKALSKKTVDEVWRDIQQEKDRIAGTQRSDKERQTALREMTLEDFLVKAGIVSDGPEKNSQGRGKGFGNSVDPVVGSQRNKPGVHWLQQYQQQADENKIVNYASNCSPPRLLNVGTSSTLYSAYPEGQNSMPSSMVCVFPESQALGRKMVDKTEKTVERKQKRMIKNRESAARSRARRQAYTNELENKVSRLEEENARLKKQKELDKLLYNAQLPQPKSKLRRTSSAPI